MTTRLAGAAAVVAALLVPAVPAGADTTLGLTGQPGASGHGICSSGNMLGQVTDDPSSPYVVPAGGGLVTQWQTATPGNNPGANLVFVVLHPIGGASYRVVATDSQTIPTPLPASGMAIYTLPTPVTVQQGDTFGLYSASGSPICSWSGGSTPTGDTIASFLPVPPSANTTESPNGSSGAGVALNVAVNLVTSQDVRVTTTTSPRASKGNLALLRSTVTNGGPNSRPITFSDAVPAGLTINQATAGAGTCAITGRTVKCTISNLSPSHGVPVTIAVTPSRSGSFANTVSVSSSAPDQIPANNTAKATLKVSPPRPAACTVPQLKGASASLAKQVLKLLGCKVKVKHVSVGGPSGTVLKTKPGPGTYSVGRKVTLTVAR